jgi:predicted dinucleotide-binding enzyme
MRGTPISAAAPPERSWQTWSRAGVVKAANTLAAEVLGADPHEAGGRRVIFLSGDDPEAKAAVIELFDAAGFFAIDLGGLVTGGRMQQLGGPLPAHNLVRVPPVK